ncbi:N-acetylglucosamine glycosyltransferase [Aeromonas veronii]|uniref:glycosyltransferase family 2 protein n=1 Tax=Aeromonas sp. YN13HZO-058 TaxID=1921564 RepID=UPI0011D0C1E2|nr:glycosyltransferase family A protein [Aeromonas sp. YN13HZO-058]BBT80995.1 N-acetylglucosamine glycosyltransferase [Aeromonas veronii]
MENPNLTILMPAFNAESYISQAICSILSQTYTNYKFVILDDGSNDNTGNIISAFEKIDGRVVFLANDNNMGVIYSRQRLVDLVDTEFFTWMDADDIAPIERIELQMNTIKSSPELVAVGGYNKFFGDKNMVCVVPCEPEDIKASLLVGNVMTMPSMIRTSLFKSSGFSFVNCGVDSAEDYAMWSKLVRCGELKNLPIVVNYYRRHKTQESTQFIEYQNKMAKNVMVDMFSCVNVKVADDIVDCVRLFQGDTTTTGNVFKIAQLYEEAMLKNKEIKFFNDKSLKRHLANSFRRHCKMLGGYGVLVFIYYFGVVEFFRGDKYGLSFVKYCFGK